MAKGIRAKGQCTCMRSARWSSSLVTSCNVASALRFKVASRCKQGMAVFARFTCWDQQEASTRAYGRHYHWCQLAASRRLNVLMFPWVLLATASYFFTATAAVWWPARRSVLPSQKSELSPPFQGNVSSITFEEALRMHRGPCGGPPQVQLLSWGLNGLYSARSTLRVALPARMVMEWLTTPEKNLEIFAKHTVRLNYRKLLRDDSRAGTRLYESSKTGQFKFFGVNIQHESTVFALEDWHSFEIRYWLKRPGAMKHFSGFWQMVPIGRRETLVVFYHEAELAFAVPLVLKPVIKRFCVQMALSMLEELSQAVDAWYQSHPPRERLRGG
mmetsp:Transcript_45266/g.125603  ORF Transcript_45266/g.125603 Transcript_45266/m.125603 type:complete len:329 (+) Transcript_45266:207-1193(+)